MNFVEHKVILHGVSWAVVVSVLAFFASLSFTLIAYRNDPPFDVWTVVVLPCTLGTFFLVYGAFALYYWYYP